MSTLNLISLTNEKEINKIKIEEIDLEQKTEILKKKAAEKLKLNSDNFVLAYCGNILSDDQPLNFYGLRNNCTIHVLKKPKPVVNDETLESIDKFHILKEFSTAIFFAVKYYWQPEELNKLKSLVPELEEDPQSLAILKDVNLLNEILANYENTYKIYPNVIKAMAKYLEANVNLKRRTTGSNPSNSMNFSIELLSDDDVDMNDSSDLSNIRTGVSNEHFLTALSRAVDTIQVPRNRNSDQQSTPISTGIITNEMFSNAIRQAYRSPDFANSSSSNSENANASLPQQGTSTGISGSESIESITRRLSPQLRQMREMGLVNVVTNVQALQATGGDVSAAIDLVFSGALSND